VHAPVAEGVDGSALEPPQFEVGRALRASSAPWVMTKPCPSPRGFSTTNIEMPRCAFERSGSVRASSISTSARAAKVHQVLTPLTTQPPSTGDADVTMPATSEP